MAQQGVEYGRKRVSRAGAQLAGLSDQISSGHLPSAFDVRVDTVFEVDRTCLTSGAVMSMGIEIARTSIAQGQKGSAILVETY